MYKNNKKYKNINKYVLQSTNKIICLSYTEQLFMKEYMCVYIYNTTDNSQEY